MPTAASSSATTANTPSIVIVKRRFACARASSSSTVLTLATGCAGSIAHTCSWTARATVTGSPAVRTSTVRRGLADCVSGKYSSAHGGRPMPPRRVSATTPTIVSHWTSLACGLLNVTRLPSGSSDGKKRRTNASFTMTRAGAVAVSSGPNSRPRVSGMPSVAKYPLVTVSNGTGILIALRGAGRPATDNVDEVGSGPSSTDDPTPTDRTAGNV